MTLSPDELQAAAKQHLWLHFTRMSSYNDGDVLLIADQLADMDEIDYVVLTAGSFDLLLEVVCEDDDHLLEILSRVRGVTSVTSTETFVYLKLRKQTYTWGTR